MALTDGRLRAEIAELRASIGVIDEGIRKLEWTKKMIANSLERLESDAGVILMADPTQAVPQSYESYLEAECRRLRDALDIAWAWMGVTVDSHNHERYLTALQRVTAVKGASRQSYGGDPSVTDTSESERP